MGIVFLPEWLVWRLRMMGMARHRSRSRIGISPIAEQSR
jgi:hypothetical protein